MFSYNISALINCHFATYAVHLYAKCVTHLTKLIKETLYNFPNLAFLFDKIRVFNSNNSILSHPGLIRKKKQSKKCLYIHETMQVNGHFSYDIPVSHIAVLTPWCQSSSHAKSAWFKTLSGLKSGFPQRSRKLLARLL